MRRFDKLTDSEKIQYRGRSEKAINGIDVLLANIQLISGKEGITEKYRTIAQYIGLIPDGVSHYNYFIPTGHDIVIMLRLSNHNNENEDLYNLHEQKGRPDWRYIIYFQGDTFKIKTCFLISPSSSFSCFFFYLCTYNYISFMVTLPCDVLKALILGPL